MKGRRGLALWFLLPSLLVLAGVVAYPFAFNLWISLTNLNMFHFLHPQFQGLGHYAKIVRLIGEPFARPLGQWPAALAQNEFYRIFGKTFAWTAVNLVFHFTLGLGAALLLNRKLPARGLYRALLILPWAMPQYIVALTWKGMFSYSYGAVNLILGRLGLGPVPWQSDATAAFASAMIANIWLGFPFMMVICLGGLQSIPQEMYEAADIDGASAWKKFWSITLPLLRPVLVPATVLGTVWTFNNLNILWLITEGGKPANQSHILVTYIYNEAFTLYRYGYAAAFSLIVFLILLIFSILFVRQTRGSEAVY